MVQCTPNICVVFLVYEQIINTFNRHSAENSAYHSTTTIDVKASKLDEDKQGLVKDIVRRGHAVHDGKGCTCNVCDRTVSCDCEVLIECPIGNDFT